jgi:dCMP deaminase
MSNKWDKRFISVARLIATWSKDPSTKVGAVIVDSHNRIVSTGFNGFPRGVIDTETPRDIKLLRTIHAEENALLFAKCDVEGMTIYVTHPPCARCAAKLIQAGIKRVVCVPADDYFTERWADDLREAFAMYNQASVFVEFLE